VANHKSALKRARQNEVRRLRNKAVKTRIKHLTQQVRLSADEATPESITGELNAAKSIIAKGAKSGVIHKRAAARKISRLDKFVNAKNAEQKMLGASFIPYSAQWSNL
jgi:small subunit ribosomal protein S20